MSVTSFVQATHAARPSVTDEDALRLVSFPCPDEPMPPAAVGAVRAKVVRHPTDPEGQPPLLALGWVRPPVPGQAWQKGDVAAQTWDPGAYPDQRQQWQCGTVTPTVVTDCQQPVELVGTLDADAPLWLAPPVGSPPDVWDALRVDGGAWCSNGAAAARCGVFAPVAGSGLTGWNTAGDAPPLVWRADGECDGVPPCVNDYPPGYCQTDAAASGTGRGATARR